MVPRKVVGLACILVITICTTMVYGQAAERPTRFMEEDDLILFNVAVKGRVVELLANEIARTEIIRALLYEYAKECVQNITVLEKSCYTCMTERCENRLAHCNINDINLSEVLTHKPSPIQGLQFLSSAPKKVTAELKDFADNARADILRDVPDNLRGKGEEIVHSEIDESMAELKGNMNTEKTLQTITIHIQKAANNVHLLPDLGEKLATLIVQNGERAVNIAELLGNRLRGARPYIDSVKENGEKVKGKAPGIMTRFGNTVAAFKDRVVGVFNTALDTFQEVLNNPDTTVVQGGQQFQQPMSNEIPVHVVVAGSQPMRSQFQSDFGPIVHRPFTTQDRDAVGQILRGLELQVQNQLEGLRGWQQDQMNQQMMQQNPQMVNFPNTQMQNIQNPHMQNLPMPHQGQGMQGQGIQQIQQGQFSQGIQPGSQGIPVGPQGVQSGLQGIQPGLQGVQVPMNGQTFPTGNQGQGQIPQPQIQQSVPLSPTQFPQNQQMQQPMVQNVVPVGPQGQQFLSQNNGQMVQVPMSNIPVQPTQIGMLSNRQGQGQPILQGRRRRRQIEPNCDKLRYDPETYCKTYEAQCHNCTLEKRLRFEVCGEGVEKARDEIKRLDNSVQDYLEAYDDYVARGPLVLKIELNDTNRLAKTNTYYDAFVTAKIGATIIRYKTKMILNINDLHVSGSQIGDEIWEKLWEKNVFAEARRLDIVQHDQHDMGQLHEFDKNVKSNVATNRDRKTQAHKSSAVTVFTMMSSIILSLACLTVFIL